MQTPGNYYVRERDREREESSEEGDGDLFRALTLYFKIYTDGGTHRL